MNGRLSIVDIFERNCARRIAEGQFQLAVCAAGRRAREEEQKVGTACL